ncbi:MAG: thioredoxin family protein [Rhodoferax sp.]
MNDQPQAPTTAALVVCLCAEWCGTCRDYRSRFAQLQAKFAPMQFLWIDVEDEADLLHPMDVEDFPTLLLAVGDEARFFGPVTPQAQMLERLIRSQIQDPAAPALRNQAISDLLDRIRARLVGGP